MVDRSFSMHVWNVLNAREKAFGFFVFNGSPVIRTEILVQIERTKLIFRECHTFLLYSTWSYVVEISKIVGSTEGCAIGEQLFAN